MGLESAAGEPGGPPSYNNWHLRLSGDPSHEAYEVPLYSDAEITSEVSDGLGPYSLINTVASVLQSGFGVLLPTIVLRVESHFPPGPPSVPRMDETEATRYHGGTLVDEVAALVSLCLGIRLKPGSVERRFGSDKDPRGRPIAYEGRDIPTLLTRRRRPILSEAFGSHSLEEARRISGFPKLSPDQAIALVKAARLYQNAVWISEGEPELAWVLFVSAIETAAAYWSFSKDDPREVLRRSRPQLVADLQAAGGDTLVRRAAQELAQIIGATRKFVRFILNYLPPPPSKRPHPNLQLSWTTDFLEQALYKIYDHRSRALHGGIAFPLPMCEAPAHHPQWDAPAEIPHGLATHALGSTWIVEDTPMLLRTFEHIVRGCLLNWWESMIGGSITQAPRDH